MFHVFSQHSNACVRKQLWFETYMLRVSQIKRNVSLEESFRYSYLRQGHVQSLCTTHTWHMVITYRCVVDVAFLCRQCAERRTE